MSATLTISVTDAVLARLRARATEQGTTPEALASETVNQGHSPKRPGDELRALAGSWTSGVSDIGSRHDEYLGENYEEEMRRTGRE